MATALAGDVMLRKSNAGDRAAVERLLASHQLPIAGIDPTLDGFVVAESAGAIVGVIGLERWGAFGLLRSAAVDAAWQGRGVGRRLVERILRDAESRELSAVYLLTTTAERWFPAFGFATTPRSEVPDALRSSVELQGACPASAILMVRERGPGNAKNV